MIRFLFLLLCFLGLPLASQADNMADMHIQSAFLFGKRHMWADAIGHARAAHNAILTKYFIWESLKDAESGADFDTLNRFIRDNPEWPDQPLLERRAEVALLANNPTDDELARWFAAHPPQTSLARIRISHEPETLRTLIREAWVNDDYTLSGEERLLGKYHSILRAEDHERRVDRLIWEGRYDEATRLLKYVPRTSERLFRARLSLAQDKLRAIIDVAALPREVAGDPGLLYERLRWRYRHNDREGVREALLQSPMTVPYPEKWWPFRDRQIREALGEKNVSLAEKLLVRHSQAPGTQSYREAEWLKGWIMLEFRGNSTGAYAVFYYLFRQTETAAGHAKVAYWAGRASEETNRENGRKWFEIAAHYPTTFYGQLAACELREDARIRIQADKPPTTAEKARFARHEVVQLVYALGRAHQSELAQRFILFLVDNADTPAEAILATRLGHDINRIDFGVRAGKKALQKDVVVLESAYPVIAVRAPKPERPLMLALTRQESEFLADAVSPSGARGLMQLLPGTAKELARKSHIPYSPDRLFNADYNLTLGGLYLQKMIDHFDGSYVLAAASYNAGPGRVSQWIAQYGVQGGSVHATVDWIEKIPFSETRNYVQHVLENTEVYRFVLANRKPVKLMIAEELGR